MIKKTFLCLIVISIFSLTACAGFQEATVEIKTPPEPLATESLPPIEYYYFLKNLDNDSPERGVVVLPGDLILAPTTTDATSFRDPAANIEFALFSMISDSRNVWSSSDLRAITSFDEGHADVVLLGSMSGTGDIILVAARMQILMTVFAEASVQTACITFNGESIANLGISHSSEAKSVDYVYTRAEIETFMAENAYGIP